MRKKSHEGMDWGSVLAYVGEVEKAHQLTVRFVIERGVGMFFERLLVKCEVGAPVLVAPGETWKHVEHCYVPSYDHPTLEGACWYLLFLCDARAGADLYKQTQFA